MVFQLFNYDFTFQEILVALLVIMLVCIISLSFHEYAHAFVAYKQGDMTAKLAGRLTLNPLAHIDMWGFICLMVAGFGWAKPVPVNPLNFKKYRTGIARVSIAGICANFILVVIASIGYVLCEKYLHLTNVFNWGVSTFFSLLMTINAFLIIFNLIPIYPLDGFNFLSSFTKPNNKYVDFNIRYGYRIFMGILFADIFIELLTGVSFVSAILSTLSSWIYIPLVKLWTLIF